MAVVRQPTDVDSLGHTAALPSSAPFLHEWEPFWVELWVDTPEEAGIGVAGGTLDLAYEHETIHRHSNRVRGCVYPSNHRNDRRCVRPDPQPRRPDDPRRRRVCRLSGSDRAAGRLDRAGRGCFAASGSYRGDRPAGNGNRRSSRESPLRRLQAAAVDRALVDRSVSRSIFTRQAGILGQGAVEYNPLGRESESSLCLTASRRRRYFEQRMPWAACPPLRNTAHAASKGRQAARGICE